MKTIPSLLLAFLVAAWPAALHAAEAPGQTAEKPEWAELFGDAPLPVVWQSADAAAKHIGTALAAGKFDGVADWAETIHLAAHALADQVKLPDAEAKKRLDAALTQAAKIADAVLDGAQHAEAATTAAAFKRLQAALALAQIRLPREITTAAAQTPRFAKAKQPDAHAH